MKYTPTHEWIVVDKYTGTVGISAYAQEELGEVVHVELPAIGKQVKAGEEIAVLESTKAAADIYSPASGKVIEVNSALKSDINLLNKSPEQQGWLFKLELSNLDELADLLDKTTYISQNKG